MSERRPKLRYQTSLINDSIQGANDGTSRRGHNIELSSCPRSMSNDGGSFCCGYGLGRLGQMQLLLILAQAWLNYLQERPSFPNYRLDRYSLRPILCDCFLQFSDETLSFFDWAKVHAIS